jgi:hypothetical protein
MGIMYRFCKLDSHSFETLSISFLIALYCQSVRAYGFHRSHRSSRQCDTSGFAEIGEVWASASKSLQVVESLQMKWQLQSPSPQEDEPSPMQQKWPQHITYPAAPKPDYEFDTVMPALGDGEMAEGYTS